MIDVKNVVYIVVSALPQEYDELNLIIARAAQKIYEELAGALHLQESPIVRVKINRAVGR